MTRNVMVMTALMVLAAGCAKNVPQDSNSGKDARPKGAKPIVLDRGDGRARDVVTYPGGDRIDWKVVEIPEGQQGDLRIKLKWRPARPGMDLAFNVFNQWFERVDEAKPVYKGSVLSKSVKIKQASGKYYIQVYASRRGDAGRYTLSVRFKERKPVALPTMEELAGQIEEPPELPAVEVPKAKTPEEIAAEEAEKARLAEEDRLAAEARATKDAEDAELRKPVFARVRKTEASSSGGVIITINVGKNAGIDKGWEGNLLQGDSKRALPDSSFRIIRVTARESVAKVQLSTDQVKANPRVELRRPGM